MQPPLVHFRGRKSSGRTRARAGFSLIELLSVIAIMTILSSLVVPALSRWGRQDDPYMAALNLTPFLERARNLAIAQGSYVWVGFAKDGDDLLCQAVLSSSGRPDLQDGAYSAFTGVQRFPYLTLGDKTISDTSNINHSDLGSFSTTIRGKNISFDYLVRFGPNGLAVTEENQTTAGTSIALSSSLRPNAETSVVQILGNSGLISAIP